MITQSGFLSVFGCFGGASIWLALSNSGRNRKKSRNRRVGEMKLASSRRERTVSCGKRVNIIFNRNFYLFPTKWLSRPVRVCWSKVQLVGLKKFLHFAHGSRETFSDAAVFVSQLALVDIHWGAQFLDEVCERVLSKNILLWDEIRGTIMSAHFYY